MTSMETARRYAASSFPEIETITLLPPGASGSLVNLSATGMLVESDARLGPGTDLTVEFGGRFTPSLVAGRVIRCEVIGITATGSLRYRLGLAFNERIALPNESAANTEAPCEVMSAAPVPGTVPVVPVVAAAPPVLRNRW